MQRVSQVELAKVLGRLPTGVRVVASGNFATPKALLRLVDESISEFRLFMLGAQDGIPNREGVIFESPFLGPGMRRSPRLNYIPCRLSLVPVLLANHYKPNLVLLHASSVQDGKVSLGVEVNILPAAIESAKKNGGLVIVQSNPKMPYTFGDGEISLEDIDYLVEVEEDLTEAPSIALNDTSMLIGERIADRVADGSTLQLGIGAIPNAVIAAMQNHRGLQIWTEMFSDGVLGLARSGAIDPDSTLTASFLFGSRDLYDWVDRNGRVHMRRTEITNDPGVISMQMQMTSINAALQVDLYDQANASYVNGLPYSGFGGSTDFIVGALHAMGGASFMALPSWHGKTGNSNIVYRLKETVTSFQHSFVVTEQGVAECFGRSASEQASNLIEFAAHPDARNFLREEAKITGLI
ncbi:MAG: acetyl-CoA hydrolase/transferase family protein [Micrococcales bacterium]